MIVNLLYDDFTLHKNSLYITTENNDCKKIIVTVKLNFWVTVIITHFQSLFSGKQFLLI